MDEFIVANKAELAAAIKAGAQQTFDMARSNPFTIKLGACVYKFPFGLHYLRAQQILRRLNCAPKKAFDTTVRQSELV